MRSDCCGILSLAYAEIYLALAALFGPEGVEFELYETNESDIVQAHDFLIPLPRLDSKGLQVRIAG